MKQHSYTPEQALLRLQDLCSRSEHSAGELRQKLWRWNINPSQADKIINQLIDERYVDDARFASAFCREKLLFSHWGRKKIAVALLAKKINRDIITTTLEQIDEDEYLQILQNTMKIKSRQIKEGNTYEGRTKLYRHMLSRGFESSLISNILHSKNSGLWD